MERGSKYGEGSRGNLKLWQSQKSGMDSFLYRVDENMTASTYSLNKIPERNLESMSSHSAHSIPLYLMPRPNSVAGESLSLSPSLNCESFLKKVFVQEATNMVIYRRTTMQHTNFAKLGSLFWQNWIELLVFSHVTPYF